MSENEHEFAGRRVVVTGGSRGLGRAIVDRFVEGGAQVIAVARSTADDDDLPFETVSADLSTLEGVDRAASTVLDRYGAVDVLVDNAGATSPPAPALQQPDDAWLTDLQINLMAAIRLDRRLAPGMIERGRGVIVHISSIAGSLPRPGQAPYAAAKSALNSYSRSLAAELGPAGVRVVNVLPGFIATPGAIDHHQRLADAAGVGLEQAQHDLATSLDVPMRRPGSPRDAAELVAFLASDRARWLTGAQYRVDGGILAQI